MRPMPRIFIVTAPTSIPTVELTNLERLTLIKMHMMAENPVSILSSPVFGITPPPRDSENNAARQAYIDPQKLALKSIFLSLIPAEADIIGSPPTACT